MAQHQRLISLIQPPVSLSDSNMAEYVNGTYDLLVQLADHQQWDEAALTAFTKQVATTVNDANLKTQFSNWQASTATVGSQAFATMFAASTMTPIDKIKHLLDTLGAHLNANTGDLVADHEFAREAGPSDAFWRELSHTVQAAFPDGLAKDDATVRMVHQLRYLIDAHNVAYVRRNFQLNGENDLEALIAFDKDALAHGQIASQADSSRMHNKQPAPLARGVLPALPTANFKRLVAFHSEFVIAPVPEPTFITVPLSQIANVNDVPAYVRGLTIEERNAMINGASFNYADANDYGQPDSQHALFDVNYGENDPMVRRLAMKPYTSPRAEPRAIALLQQQYDAAVRQQR
ncbi:MAG TPA: hypothetical protein DCW31_02010 [Lactobacillus sp.]|nr:hypothetical protein [Lactobacillus sp.]